MAAASGMAPCSSDSASPGGEIAVLRISMSSRGSSRSGSDDTVSTIPDTDPEADPDSSKKPPVPGHIVLEQPDHKRRRLAQRLLRAAKTFDWNPSAPLPVWCRALECIDKNAREAQDMETAFVLAIRYIVLATRLWKQSASHTPWGRSLVAPYVYRLVQAWELSDQILPNFLDDWRVDDWRAGDGLPVFGDIRVDPVRSASPSDTTPPGSANGLPASDAAWQITGDYTIHMASEFASCPGGPQPAPPPPRGLYPLRPVAYREDGKPLRALFLPRTLPQRFLRLAKANTDRGIETYGVLCGRLRGDNQLAVTHLLLPQQTGTESACRTTDDEGTGACMREHGLLQLGWIHSHPTQACFMSAKDLHTHTVFQRVVDESVAVVCAPARQTKPAGFFRIRHDALAQLEQCEPGPDGEHACREWLKASVDACHPRGPVFLVPTRNIAVLDLR